MYPIIIVVAVVILDQLIKWLVVANIMPKGDITVIPHFFNLTYVENYGIAFGMFKNKTMFFIVAITAISLVICYLIFKTFRSHVLATVCLSMILGGAIGNLIDRIRLGYVVDYLSFSIFPPVFNLADSAVVVGAILLGILVVFDKSLTI